MTHAETKWIEVSVLLTDMMGVMPSDSDIVKDLEVICDYWKAATEKEGREAKMDDLKARASKVKHDYAIHSGDAS